MYAMNIYAAGKDVGCFGETECGKIATKSRPTKRCAAHPHRCGYAGISLRRSHHSLPCTACSIIFCLPEIQPIANAAAVIDRENYITFGSKYWLNAFIGIIIHVVKGGQHLPSGATMEAAPSARCFHLLYNLSAGTMLREFSFRRMR